MVLQRLSLWLLSLASHVCKGKYTISDFIETQNMDKCSILDDQKLSIEKDQDLKYKNILAFYRFLSNFLFSQCFQLEIFDKQLNDPSDKQITTLAMSDTTNNTPTS